MATPFPSISSPVPLQRRGVVQRPYGHKRSLSCPTVHKVTRPMLGVKSPSAIDRRAGREKKSSTDFANHPGTVVNQHQILFSVTRRRVTSIVGDTFVTPYHDTVMLTPADIVSPKRIGNKSSPTPRLVRIRFADETDREKATLSTPTLASPITEPFRVTPTSSIITNPAPILERTPSKIPKKSIASKVAKKVKKVVLGSQKTQVKLPDSLFESSRTQPEEEMTHLQLCLAPRIASFGDELESLERQKYETDAQLKQLHDEFQALFEEFQHEKRKIENKITARTGIMVTRDGRIVDWNKRSTDLFDSDSEQEVEDKMESVGDTQP